MPILKSLQAKVAPQAKPSKRSRGRVELQDTSTVPDTISDGWLTSLIETHDARPEPNRKADKLIHVSSLISGCPRAMMLAVKDDINGFKQVRGAERLIWAIGRAVEGHIRRAIVEQLNYKGVTGSWACHCGDLCYSGKFNENQCESCGGLATNYFEAVFADRKAGIIGSPDILVESGTGRLRIVEIKSIALKYFNELTGAQADHAIQVAAYHRIAKSIGHNVDDHCTVIYGAKDFAFRSPYKEFSVNPNQPHIQASLDIMWANAAMIRSGRIPPRLTQCHSPSSTTAKNCACAASCFAREN